MLQQILPKKTDGRELEPRTHGKSWKLYKGAEAHIYDMFTMDHFVCLFLIDCLSVSQEPRCLEIEIILNLKKKSEIKFYTRYYTALPQINYQTLLEQQQFEAEK